jgi:hypothetical protein
METRDLIIKYIQTRGYEVNTSRGDGLLSAWANRTSISKNTVIIGYLDVNGSKVKIISFKKPGGVSALPDLAVDIYEPDSLARVAEFLHALCVSAGMFC